MSLHKKYTIFFTFFFAASFSFKSSKSVAFDKQDHAGILIKFEMIDGPKSLTFTDFKQKYFLKEEKRFENLNAILFKSKNKKIDQKHYIKICKRALRLKGIVGCELDRALESNADPCNPINPIDIAIANSSLQPIVNLRCTLLQSDPQPHGTDGLSTFWAQEYTGSDLLRQRIIDSNFPAERYNNLFSVWDTDRNFHGENVSNLIRGNHPTSLLPGNSQAFSETGHLSAFLDVANSCLANRCSNYISNSQSYDTNLNITDLVVSAVRQVAESGRVFILGAGNAREQIGEGTRQLARAGQVLIVSSLNPAGSPSDFTNFAPEVTISAPSNHELTSFSNSSGSLTRFGGTSGATPQVTAALAAFTLITGYPLSTSESRRLLAKTALPIPGMPSPHNLGSGMLNSYRIGELAYRANEICSNSNNQTQCVRSFLETESSYEPTNDDQQALRQAQEVFPSCSPASPPATPGTHLCDRKVEAFQNLRRATLLAPQNPILWRLMACILRQEQNLSKNAEYYDNMANHLETSNQQLLNNLISRPEGAGDALDFVLSHPEWQRDPAVLSEIEKNINNGQNDRALTRLLGTPEWQNHPKASLFFSGLIDRGQFDSEAISLLSEDPWRNHPSAPQFFETLVRRKANSQAMSELLGETLTDEFWQNDSNSTRFFEIILDTHKDYESIAELLVYEPYWQSHPRSTQYVEKLLANMNSNESISNLLSQEHWQNHPKSTQYFETLLSKEQEDDSLALLLLEEYWQKHPKSSQYLEEFIRRGVSDDSIEYILEDEFWQKRYRNKVDGELSAESLREYLRQH